MGGIGKDAQETAPHPSEAGHRSVLPHGKPRGVATENGKSFEEAGLPPSDYKEEEYDVNRTYQEASVARDREVFGSLTKGDDDVTISDQSNASESNSTEPTLMDKMKTKLKNPMTS